MSLARLVITAVTVERRSKSEVARDCGISRVWAQKLVHRFQTEGEAAFEPRSRRPHSNPRMVDLEVEDPLAMRTVVTGCLVYPVARCLRNLASTKGVACLAQHHSADTLRSGRGFRCSPGLPNRGGRGGTSKVWPRAIVLTAQRVSEVVGRMGRITSQTGARVTSAPSMCFQVSGL